VDDSVIRAMAKWPNVPSVYGWLSLDRRGNWLIKGERITNPAVIDFIGRNYSCDERGRWFFQNGPQRVFVRLDYTPFVIRTVGGEDFLLEAHNGKRLDHASGAWLDEKGALILRWSEGVGVVADRDLEEVSLHFTDSRGTPIAEEELAKALEGGSIRKRAGFWFDYGGERLPVGRIDSDQVQQKFGFYPDPRPAAGEPEC
jgi:hypothetical protein